MANCLNDDVQNIKFVAWEALATLCFKGLWNQVLEILLETIVKSAYSAFCDWIEKAPIPTFDEENLVFTFAN